MQSPHVFGPALSIFFHVLRGVLFHEFRLMHFLLVCSIVHSRKLLQDVGGLLPPPQHTPNLGPMPTSGPCSVVIAAGHTPLPRCWMLSVEVMLETLAHLRIIQGKR